MFQSFDIATNPDNAKSRVSALRKEMEKLGLDGYLIPRADEHQGEYVPPHALPAFALARTKHQRLENRL